MEPNSQLKMIAAVTGGVAQATITPPATKPDIRLPSLLSSSPTSVPTTMVRVTATTANSTVFRSVCQKNGSLRILSKFSVPTCSAGSPRSWRLPTFWNDMIPIWIIGQNIRTAITSTVGAISR
ncbi:hypothetical protein LUX33_43320 [Actinomadura madurae]|uniref:hypothetical protein n=1 Tax=Actinomadura madurae TaxID=1993 RepID=UPI0020D1FB19|nr:hypothetical protein [Actinomadura madurae]MCP9954557.1 hypothetical protein [Actinomadura madurae]